MGDEGTYIKLIEQANSIERLTPESAKQVALDLQSILNSRPRNKDGWNSSYDVQVASADKKPKTRYSFNSFGVIIAEVQIIIEQLKLSKIDTTRIESLREAILAEIKKLRTRARKIATDITDTAPPNLHNKYGREAIWKAVAKGTYEDIAGDLAESKGEDLQIHPNIEEGRTVQTELTRIKAIK